MNAYNVSVLHILENSVAFWFEYFIAHLAMLVLLLINL